MWEYLAVFLLAAFSNGCHLIGDLDDILDGKEPPPPGTTVFKVKIENVFTPYKFFQSGVFSIPEDKASPGPLFPGESYKFSFYAGKGHYLSFATMFVQSNDLFYAPDKMGIPMFDGMKPLEGDITKYILLWDAGTEVNEKPGEGANQAPRSGADTGMDEGGNVRLVDDMYEYPEVSEVIKVESNYMGNNKFEITIINVSNSSTLPVSSGSVAVPLSPGVYVIHTEPEPLFTPGEPDYGNGLEAIAEDGDPSGLGEYLNNNTGYVSPLSPGIFVEHAKNKHILFKAGYPDFGMGLEDLAEDGDVSVLEDNLSYRHGVKVFGIFDTPENATEPGILMPGNSYEFKFLARPGYNLSFATMLVQSNDLFFAPDGEGLPLFKKGKPITGNITKYIQLWDAGTEVNQFPGAGNYQAPRQPAADTGEDEGGVVRIVDDPYTYPDVDEMIKVTIEAE